MEVSLLHTDGSQSTDIIQFTDEIRFNRLSLLHIGESQSTGALQLTDGIRPLPMEVCLHTNESQPINTFSVYRRHSVYDSVYFQRKSV